MATNPKTLRKHEKTSDLKVKSKLKKVAGPKAKAILKGHRAERKSAKKTFESMGGKY